jgi:hypothetical protein
MLPVPAETRSAGHRPFPGRSLLCAVLLTLPLLRPAEADDPWRIDDAWTPPDWLSISGSHQLRYQWLDNTYRIIDPGTDDLLESRLLFAAEARVTETLRLGAELQDSRAWGAGARTPLNTTNVNALEPLQLYAGLTLRDLFAEDETLDLRLGRFTMQMGSNRYIARHIYRNALQAHTGATLIWSRQDGPRLQLFATNPVRRLPFERSALEDNEIRFDEDSATVFWGAHLDGLAFGAADAAVYLFGIDDSDTTRRPTRNRNYLTAGFRLLGADEDWYWELESAYQFGTVRETILPGDTEDLDHRAWLLHADIGRRLTGRWRPVVELRYDYASGDDRPGDDSNERFDSLFGPLRFDYGPTSIYNAIRRENSSALGLYLTVAPDDSVRWMTGYRAAWLASARDRFGASGLRDPAGASGNFVGHQIETRYRWDLLPGNLQLEFGGALLLKGEFLEDAPLAPDTGNTIYLYTMLTTRF